MAIYPSSAREIDALIADLGARSSVTRESAVARLTLVGSRAVERLISLIDQPDGSTASRVAALRALEGVGDSRALGAALRAAFCPNADIAAAGVAVIRTFMRGPQSIEAIDGLAAIALNHAVNEATRLEAIGALGDLDPTTVQPLWQTLARDPSPRIRARSVTAQQPELHERARPIDLSAPQRLGSIAELGLPDDPELLSRLLTTDGVAASPSQLHRIVELIREREGSEAPARRGGWTRARGSAHVALAKQSSLLGLYDLREALERAIGPLPVEFLAALALIGDASCLEAIAIAHSRTPDRWWREHLADAFQAIIRRERLTRRHAVLKKIQKRWPAIVPTN